MGDPDFTLSSTEAQRLLTEDSGWSPKSVHMLDSSHVLYKMVESIMDDRLVYCEHTFRLESLEVACTPAQRSREFKRRLSSTSPGSRISLMFHGTNAKNHGSIFESGFREECYGKTDKGFIGKGVYLSPHPEYAAAYIKNARGICSFEYREPVDVGATCKVLGCVALVGRTKRLCELALGAEISSSLDSHWAWVNSSAMVTGKSSEHFALEYVFREFESAFPKFRLSLKRVTREVVWFDPNITNSENSGHAKRLKDTGDIFLYATSRADKALAALKRRKAGTDYRVLTAGSGGEDFVRRLRAAGVCCSVLVFCMSVDYHRKWAGNFKNVTVTNSSSTMKEFCTWRRCLKLEKEVDCVYI